VKEHVGECSTCGKTIYCHDGFLNGHVEENGQLSCFDCSNEAEEGKSDD
jgi:hypothetical protein